jgi:hypothetical protein
MSNVLTDLLNQIRQRNSLPMPTMSMALNKDGLIDLYRQELRDAKTDLPRLIAVIEKLIEQRNANYIDYVQAAEIEEYLDVMTNRLTQMNKELATILSGESETQK